MDASVKGRRFHAEALDTEMRWPAFTPKALALGINSILSSPLGASNTPVGRARHSLGGANVSVCRQRPSPGLHICQGGLCNFRVTPKGA